LLASILTTVHCLLNFLYRQLVLSSLHLLVLRSRFSTHVAAMVTTAKCSYGCPLPTLLVLLLLLLMRTAVFGGFEGPPAAAADA
jgi:hypothetical protein